MRSPRLRSRLLGLEELAGIEVGLFRGRVLRYRRFCGESDDEQDRIATVAAKIWVRFMDSPRFFKARG